MEKPAWHEGQPHDGRRSHNEKGDLRKGVKKSGELGVTKGIARISPVSKRRRYCLRKVSRINEPHGDSWALHEDPGVLGRKSTLS